MPASRSSDSQGELDRQVGRLIQSGGVSAVVALVGDGERILAEASGGDRTRLSRRHPTRNSLFDLASVSKPVTATLALLLNEAGDLDLGARVGEFWQRAGRAIGDVTLAELLRHRSRLPPWAPLYARHAGPDDAVHWLLSDAPALARRGTYSDLGYILWLKTAERATGLSGCELLRRRLLLPLGLARDVVCQRPDKRRLVECPLDMQQEVELARRQQIEIAPSAPDFGQVQDGNARWLGTYSGHAGLFGSAKALWRFGSEWLYPGLLGADTAHRATSGGGPFLLGWRRATSSGGAGPALSPAAFGHTGFTGCSLWIDPTMKRIFVVVAHRTSTGFALNPWRRRLHSAMAAF